jgi:nicotinic acid mononucleotide adenylyltransferase
MSTIIFTISRMNPPTPGHMEVVKELFRQAIRLHEQTVYIILSKTRDKKNPIPCESTADSEVDKLTMLEYLVEGLRQRLISSTSNRVKKAKYQDIRVVTMCVRSDEATPFSRLKNFMKDHEDVRNLFLVVGEDRDEMVDSIWSFLNKESDKVYNVTEKPLARTGSDRLKTLTKDEYMTLDLDRVQPSEISGTFVRNLARDNQWEIFKQLYLRYNSDIPEVILKRLYHTIKGERGEDVSTLLPSTVRLATYPRSSTRRSTVKGGSRRPKRFTKKGSKKKWTHTRRIKRV